MRTITSDRLLLRPWRDDDADFLLDLESRWGVVRFLGAHPTTMSTREDALDSIARRRAIDDPIHGIWAITTAEDGRLVGNLLLKPIPLSAGEPSGGPNDVEIGWHLHPDAWGHGYATEAAEAVLDDAFSRGLTKVLAVTDPDNHASQSVCRRLGMTHLGRTTRYYDTPNELFEKLPSWPARPPRSPPAVSTTPAQSAESDVVAWRVIALSAEDPRVTPVRDDGACDAGAALLGEL